MPDPWHQYNITFPDRTAAVTIAAHHLRPVLNMAQDAGLLHGWWFLRKQPWPLRLIVDDPGYTIIDDRLNALTADGRIIGWASGIYEPEIVAFGGGPAMDVAHTLFHHDSNYLLARAAQLDVSPLRQREVTALLCSVMLRAAGLDWYEQGDVWKKVAELRPLPASGAVALDRIVTLTAGMRRLMTADTRSLCEVARNGPLIGYDRWVSAFEDAGRALADLSRHGKLRRGLRAVAAHHIIFHANRAGLSIGEQSILAALALNTVFNADGDRVFPSALHPTTTKVTQMTTLSDNSAPSTPSADQLRTDMTDRLSSRNVIRTPAVEEAFRRTPRHLFLPEAPLEEAYRNKPVYIKTDDTGQSISAASQPGMVAVQLEQLDPQPGEKILEIGLGTGYNAALMGAIVGEDGHVVSIDVDPDLVNGARAHLAAAGVTNVEALLGDGALGHPAGAPYDRVIATVGAYEVPPAWLEQLSPSGRLVVPLRLRGTASRSITFERGPDGWYSPHSALAVFMPLRGIGDDARRIVTLTPEGDVTLQVNKDQTVDGHALAGVLDTKRHETWTGMIFPPEVSYEWLELWLCMTLDNPLMRMNVENTAVERGQVTPMFPWGSMATTRAADLAYLTTRPAPPADDGGKLYQVGVISHGPTGEGLAELVAEQIETWNATYRDRTARFEIPDRPETADPAAGRFVLERPHHPMTVIWE